MPPDDVLPEVRAWVSKAEGDFKNIELVMPSEDAPFDTVCFHAQQAAEKYLKALLTFRGVPFGKTHDLSELALLLPEESSVPGSCGDLADLADAAVASRYPDDLVSYDRELAEELVRQAKTVRSAVLAELERLGYTSPG
jgi:HEPN domain-containing protein